MLKFLWVTFILKRNRREQTSLTNIFTTLHSSLPSFTFSTFWYIKLKGKLAKPFWKMEEVIVVSNTIKRSTWKCVVACVRALRVTCQSWKRDGSKKRGRGEEWVSYDMWGQFTRGCGQGHQDRHRDPRAPCVSAKSSCMMPLEVWRWSFPQ